MNCWLTTVEHYRAWLAAKYAQNGTTIHAQRAQRQGQGAWGDRGERRIRGAGPGTETSGLPLHLHRKRLLSRLDLQVPLAVFMQWKWQVRCG